MDKSAIDAIAERCFDADDAQLWMIKFCSAMDRGNTPDADTLAFFKERFEEVQSMILMDQLPADEIRDKLPEALGIKLRKPGKQSHVDGAGRKNVGAIAKSKSFRDACAVEELIRSGMRKKKAYEKVAGERSANVVKKNYLKHKKAGELENVDRWEKIKKQNQKNRNL